MGGGDLNLKKSWHPQTLRNVEKVWKAEQKHEAERKKIEELQKELREERAREEMQRYAEDTGAVKKKDEKLDWMYQGPGGMVNREEYLLGRPVDKYIMDKMQEPESGPSSETGLLPGSIFSAAGASSTLDLANKIREDPLFMIRKREDEKKREVLKNPVKMNKIREMLQSSLEKKSKKKKKEKKKRRKERRDSSSSEEDSSDEERESSRNRSHKHHKHSPSPPARHGMSGYGLQVKDHGQGSRGDHTNKHRARAHSRSPHRDSKGSRSSGSHGGRKRSPSPQKPEAYRRQRPSGYTKKLSAEELERRRQEMMEDAQQREKEREWNVRRYKQEEEKEEEKGKQKKESKFIHQIKLESAASSSVEDRVKRNIHGIQRTTAALEKNFMKR
ncbi:pre-mRNA-splicing factor CWC25 homolog [Xenopus tropicalis]|uniref:LOC100145020 protein n=1 Tax=Xenopus tropicalis TaxID=8364 RepID=B0BMD3_XENTR|nr:pre-mRNA-splicing factor CWC25 homolog [Xenopus tropicalis]AAI58382.1 LOC100145020 protein [Xenopus tropicalis]|eukprot:NP_001120044.1 pre-mRNA-splicing factor CWC25 homolog [Xenopus tropicalis]